MRKPMRTETAEFDASAAKMLFEHLLTLNNGLTSLTPQYLVPVLEYEDEIGRERAIAALGCVLKFLRDVGIPGEAREPLNELHAALVDAKVGRSNPIIKPAPMEPGTPDKLVLQYLDDGMAAAAVDILIRVDRRRPREALQFVADAFGYRVQKLDTIRKNLRAPKRAERPNGKKPSPRASTQAVEAYKYWMKERERRGLSGRDFVAHLIETRGFKSQR